MSDFNAACDRIFDLLLPDDGYAMKVARKFLEGHRPDLAARLDEIDAATTANACQFCLGQGFRTTDEFGTPEICDGCSTLEVTDLGATEYGALVRDAKRWRFYRDGTHPMNDAARIDAMGQYGEALDAAIDAAMEAAK